MKQKVINPDKQSDSNSKEPTLGMINFKDSFKKNSLEDDITTFRHVNKIRNEICNQIFNSDYALRQVIILCRKVRFNIKKMSVVFNFYEPGSKVPLKKAEILKKINYIVEVLDENKRDYKKIQNLVDSSPEKQRLNGEIDRRNKIAAGVISTFHIRDSFLLGNLYEKLKNLSKSFDCCYENEEERIIQEKFLRSKVHQEKGDFLKYFDSVNKIIIEYLEIRNNIFQRNKGLIYDSADKFPIRLPYADAVQEGTIGFFNAIERYDPSSGQLFSTYAVNCVKYAIKKAEKLDRKPPVHIFNEILTLINGNNNFFNEFGRTPSPQELASYLNISLKKINYLIECVADLDYSSKMAAFGKVSESRFRYYKPANFDLIQKERIAKLNVFLNELFDQLPKELLKNFVNCSDEYRNKLLCSLDRNIKILKLHFGFIDGIPHTFDEISKQFNMRRSRAHMICLTLCKYLTNILKDKSNNSPKKRKIYIID